MKILYSAYAVLKLRPFNSRTGALVYICTATYTLHMASLTQSLVPSLHDWYTLSNPNYI